MQVTYVYWSKGHAQVAAGGGGGDHAPGGASDAASDSEEEDQDEEESDEDSSDDSDAEDEPRCMLTGSPCLRAHDCVSPCAGRPSSASLRHGSAHVHRQPSIHPAASGRFNVSPAHPDWCHVLNAAARC